MKSLKIISFGIIMGFILLSGLMEQAVEAQPSKVPAGPPVLPAHPQGACRMDPSITFTKEQAEKLASLQRAFSEEAKPLWSELRDLRIELRFAVSDPQIQPQVLLDKQRRMSAIQAKLENLRFSYLIRARTIFTKEQLERMPPDCPLKMRPGLGMGKGRGKGRQKGIY
jgi:hypothetical protein